MNYYLSNSIKRQNKMKYKTYKSIKDCFIWLNEWWNELNELSNTTDQLLFCWFK